MRPESDRVLCTQFRCPRPVQSRLPGFCPSYPRHCVPLQPDIPCRVQRQFLPRFRKILHLLYWELRHQIQVQSVPIAGSSNIQVWTDLRFSLELLLERVAPEQAMTFHAKILAVFGHEYSSNIWCKAAAGLSQPARIMVQHEENGCKALAIPSRKGWTSAHEARTSLVVRGKLPHNCWGRGNPGLHGTKTQVDDLHYISAGFWNRRI